ncbi:MAG TPA: hypothetical protein VK679_17100 [Gemmatimonadaceae bacterium]|nr:hypothetical protein [Gemmatimonadaceae bacterium]
MRWFVCALFVAAPLVAQDTASGHHMMMMMQPGPLGLPMNRMGSGTSWLPDETPMHAEHMMAGGWQFMLHYMAFANYDHQESTRNIDGATQFNGIDWFMGMAQHDVGASRLTLRAMLSTDPFTVGKAGYPLLLQTGESYRGEPLHDRQHPHDLFMELAAVYDAPVTSDVAVELYAAPAGEPALGPVAYPHRPSAAGDPYAPLGHHWQDATHISFGVLTAGVFTHGVKLEGSIFNGREPDETRTNFDFRTLDSYSGRVTMNPAPAWSVSASYGYLKSPEQLTPNISQHRMGASVLFDQPFNGKGEWSTALVYGANLYSDSPQLSNSVDLETTLDLDGTNTIFWRAEYVNKDAYDLALGAAPPAGRFDVGSGTIGYSRELMRAAGIAIALGGVATVDLIPTGLRPYYGTRTPYGFGVFLRFRPADRHSLMHM